MKTLCVTPTRTLSLQDLPLPSTPPPPGYINVAITAAAINHGDIAFLKLRNSLASGGRLDNIWGASASGTVTAIGPNVPATYLHRNVAIYRGLKPAATVRGMWCEEAQVPYDCCLLLPESGVDVKDYCGSLVNVVTAYAFLEQVVAEGHRGVVVTAGGSATARALLVLARRRGVPVVVVVRSEKAKAEVLLGGGVGEGDVLDSSAPGFLVELERRAQEIGATAVFDGVGGALVGKMLGALPRGSSIFFYGFLSGAEKVEFHSSIFIMKNFTMRMFSNFETVTVKERLGDMLKDLEGCISDPMFRTSLGKDFEPEEIEAAMEYKGGSKKAVLVFSK